MNVHVDPISRDFHNNSLLGASLLGSKIKLTIEYLSENDVEFSVSVIIRDVKEILRNDLPIPEFKMETGHGSIVAVE